MLFKTFSLLISVGQAIQVLRGSAPHATSSNDDTTPIPVNGTLTSFSVLEGSGCPAGSYHAQPIEPGKSLNTYVDVDPSIFFFNSTTTPAPVTCTLNINFEFVYPENGQAELFIGAFASNDIKFEEGDTVRETNFNVQVDMLATAGAEELDGGLIWTRIIDEGPMVAQVGVGLVPVGTPGEVGVGTFQAAISISTTYGPGEISLSRLDIGFGL
ncbi:uncharacterized protein CC84DRAFT_1257000 [Paraphaeosphaeria sporulosa]|uniref:Ubiquitin 3 binding protein But2 C-terminal domain-containing protein n=1 Tax=Paraphaeosphaeria sporulosa TaxID=1460663 RepID=A0A177CMN3_9PLEO|nr:uncharacterized protein CC84DRAFT_1257000 [Paraphaeosphaeria sporulosa]OAG08069.1 hypothetical protein CC84DRAFT_1257000 [Paraphaeosphaeria sporulosa]